jgi:hypothetical protein
MDFEKFSSDEDEKFFRDGAKMIYDWLPVEMKNKLGQEIAAEGLSDIMDLGEKKRFFRLLNFLEVNYVKIGLWMNKTLKHVEKLQDPQKKDSISDIEIEFGGEKIRLSDMLAEFTKNEIDVLFDSTLKNLGLTEKYKAYTEKTLRTSDYELSE